MSSQDYKNNFANQFMKISNSDAKVCGNPETIAETYTISVLEDSDIRALDATILKDGFRVDKYENLNTIVLNRNESIYVYHIDCAYSVEDFIYYWKQVCYTFTMESVNFIESQSILDRLKVDRAIVRIYNLLKKMVEVKYKNEKYEITFKRPIFPKRNERVVHEGRRVR